MLMDGVEMRTPLRPNLRVKRYRRLPHKRTPDAKLLYQESSGDVRLVTQGINCGRMAQRMGVTKHSHLGYLGMQGVVRNGVATKIPNIFFVAAACEMGFQARSQELGRPGSIFILIDRLHYITLYTVPASLPLTIHT